MNTDSYLLEIPNYAKVKATIPEVKAFLEAMGHPERDVRVIHIAGTNGKGSVCAYLTRILVESGHKVATFTSPHLIAIRERFQFGGSFVSEEDYQNSFENVRHLAGVMMEKGYRHPTFFEFLFYMQMDLIRTLRPEWLILETGMGGRRDVTNAVENPFLVILTSISRDHMQYLGDTLEEIAGEKAGIIKSGVPVVFDAGNPVAFEVIRKTAEQMNSPYIAVERDDWNVEDCDCDAGQLRAVLFGKSCIVPFPAEYQAANAALAYQAAKILTERMGQVWDEEQEQNVLAAISHTKWQGRMEQVLPGVYVDGAHNEGGIHALTLAVRRMYDKGNRKMVLLFASASDKEYDKMLGELCREIPFAAIVAVCYESSRALSLEELGKELRLHAKCPFYLYPNVEEALEQAIRLKEDGILFCAGSLYLVGEMKDVIRRKYHD